MYRVLKAQTTVHIWRWCISVEENEIDSMVWCCSLWRGFVANTMPLKPWKRMTIHSRDLGRRPMKKNCIKTMIRTQSLWDIVLEAWTVERNIYLRFGVDNQPPISTTIPKACVESASTRSANCKTPHMDNMERIRRGKDGFGPEWDADDENTAEFWDGAVLSAIFFKCKARYIAARAPLKHNARPGIKRTKVW